MFDRYNISLSFKITLLIMLAVLIATLILGSVAYVNYQENTEAEYKEKLVLVTRLKTQKVQDLFARIRTDIKFAASLDFIKDELDSPQQIQNISSLLPDDSDETNADTLDLFDSKPDSVRAEDTLPRPEPLEDTLDIAPEATVVNVTENLQYEEFGEPEEETEIGSYFARLLENYDINQIYLTDREGKIIYVKHKNANNQQVQIGENFNYYDQDGNIIRVGLDSVYFSNVFFQNDTSQNAVNKDGYRKYMYVSAPVFGKDNLAKGVVIFDIDLRSIYEMVSDSLGLGKTGEIRLAKDFESSILFLNPARGEDFNIFVRSRNQPIRKDRNIPAQEASKGLDGMAYARDGNGEEVLASWSFIPIVNWGMVVQINKAEIEGEKLVFIRYLLISLGAIAIILLFFALSFSRIMVQAIQRLKEVVNLLSQGILSERISVNSRDEIGDMAYKLNVVVDNLQNTADFARKIGQGEFEAEFRPVGDQDNLGMALLTMRDSIQQSVQRDDERNWIVTGLAEIGDILPSITTIDELGDLVSEYVTNKISAVQGAFYTVDDEDEENPLIVLQSTYAYNKKKYVQSSFRFAEGLVGQSAIEQDTIVRTEIPDNYMTISSGILGDQKPKCILITPLITNETVYGVLEFAGFERFGSREIEFVEEISEIIARTVFNIKVKENTEKLLHESQTMSSELRVQQEVLRQNAEEMEATQEELQRTNKELENQIREVQRATDRTRILLENASEVITIYEADATIRYISPSVEKILGYTQDEMIGIRDIAYVHSEGVEFYEQMFKDLVDKPDEKVTIEYSYQTKSGQRIWLEATGTNFLSDPAIQGIVLNARDITERRAAEREQRLRGQMQALSENSPDLITRISKEGTVFYINPTIETYTGKNKDNFIQKHIRELDLGEEILDSWNDILKDVITKNQKISLDMDFPSVMGERVMQVNAIPEYNDLKNLESVLVVSHDITERKIIELEISQKNRKITESINYAKRIQEAILPDTNYIRQFLRESFILYKPRDVVSGDFPWFSQKGDEIFIAAVDCTGHGVPGALISLIGFFLLNNIVNVKDASTPGEILDILDEEVTRTLKQDESDSSTKDGMDIALCKINPKKRQLEYAGAHRPLYYMSGGDLHEIKGNKFPIGGAQYKNRGKFTNTVINYKADDSVYLFSDGFPDQFGGPKNKKFSPRQIREIIKANSDLSLAEIYRILDRQFEEWRGNNKQTDDVLMIGIKL